jgi:hypothetical protein
MNTDRINFIPSIWGGAAWKFLHCVALSYPKNASPQTKQDYKDFFLSLDKILPCSSCSQHFKNNKSKHNINKYLSGPHELFSWTVKIRNEVQIAIKRPLFNELELRESFYKQNENFGRFHINPKVKFVLMILSVIGLLYIISAFFKIKITPKK